MNNSILTVTDQDIEAFKAQYDGKTITRWTEVFDTLEECLDDFDSLVCNELKNPYEQNEPYKVIVILHYGGEPTDEDINEFLEYIYNYEGIEVVKVGIVANSEFVDDVFPYMIDLHAGNIVNFDNPRTKIRLWDDVVICIEECRDKAMQGDAEAQLMYGHYFYYLIDTDYHGMHTREYIVECSKWYAKAAEQGNEEAKEMIERCKEEGRWFPPLPEPVAVVIPEGLDNVKIFTNDIEDEAMEQIRKVASNPVMEKSKIRIMPDVHAGKGITIGFTCTLGEYVNPEYIGVDIGCGIETEFFTKMMDKSDIAKFEQLVKEAIPFGRTIHERPVFRLEDLMKEINEAMNSSWLFNRCDCNIAFNTEWDVHEWCDGINLNYDAFVNSIGTIGGGNHFIELDCNEELGKMGVTIHTGSRIVGQKVCAKWTKVSKTPRTEEEYKMRFEAIKSMTEDKSQLQQIGKELRRKLEANFHEGFLKGDDRLGYLTDMIICQAYARFNRKVILQKIAEIYKSIVGDCEVEEIVSSVHNYIDFEQEVIRKGAISSRLGEKMVIPFNMRDGIAICEGRSNDDWNFSCSHGSGRRMSREKAKKAISLDEFSDSMQGIYSTSVCENTIDESPQAYKDTQEIIANIAPTCKVLYFMKPVMNIKDSSSSKE